MKMKRADLVAQLVEKYHYTKKSAKQIIDDFSQVILDNLQNGDAVALRNLGTFDIVMRAERQCPNPVTGERCIIPAHYVPRFYPGDTMRTAVKIWEDNVKRGLADG